VEVTAVVLVVVMEAVARAAVWVVPRGAVDRAVERAVAARAAVVRVAAVRVAAVRVAVKAAAATRAVAAKEAVVRAVEMVEGGRIGCGGSYWKAPRPCLEAAACSTSSGFRSWSARSPVGG